jgi:hypothetical protein
VGRFIAPRYWGGKSGRSGILGRLFIANCGCMNGYAGRLKQVHIIATYALNPF